MTRNVKMEEGWKQVLAEEFDKPYFKQLTDYIRSEYAKPGQHVYRRAIKNQILLSAKNFKRR